MWDSSLLWRDWAFWCLVLLRQLWRRFYRTEPCIRGIAQPVSMAVEFLLISPWYGWAIPRATLFLNEQDIQLVPPVHPGKRGSCSGTNTLEALSLAFLWPPSLIKKNKIKKGKKHTYKNLWERSMWTNRTYLTGTLTPDCVHGPRSLTQIALSLLLGTL